MRCNHLWLQWEVVNHACMACPTGKTSIGNHDASGDGTTCEATTCGTNEKVVNYEYVACPSGKTSTGKHNASGTAFPIGKTSSGQHDASGGNALCEAITVVPMRRW